jgi:hypothetical protein
VRLPPPIEPHLRLSSYSLLLLPLPRLESAVALASLPKLGGRVGCELPLKSHVPAHFLLCKYTGSWAGQVSAAGRVEEHWHSVALHNQVGRQIDGLKGAEENERKISVPCFSLQLPDWSNSKVEEKLWQSIPQKAFSAKIYDCSDIELVCCPWTVWILGHQAEAVLPFAEKDQSDQIHILIYTMIYTMIYCMANGMVYFMVYTVFKVCYKYLGILSKSLKTMSWPIKWITTCLWPVPIFFTFPLKSCQCPQMSPISVWHKDCCKDAVEFCNCKLKTQK